jgi:flagellar motility protein MotE (MotC chaperone)
MKKKKTIIAVFIITILFVKLFAAGELFKKFSGVSPDAFDISKALADTNQNNVTIEPVDSTKIKDSLSQERSLMKALEQRQRDIVNRERRLQDEEQRLQALKQEIVTKIDILIGLEERLNTAIEAAKATENKKYKDLARVYDATPADKVSAMLERMDTRTAANITMNMKKDKAGAVLGHLNPQRAIEITKEITRISSSSGGHTPQQPPEP